MTTKQITAANVNEQIKQLYQTAFPEDEQIPWEDLVRLIGEMHLDFTAYYEGEDFIGFTIVFPYEQRQLDVITGRHLVNLWVF